MFHSVTNFFHLTTAVIKREDIAIDADLIAIILDGYHKNVSFLLTNEIPNLFFKPTDVLQQLVKIRISVGLRVDFVARAPRPHCR